VTKVCLFPNPCSGPTASVILPLSGSANITVQVFTLAFRKVLSQNYPQVAPGTVLSFPLKDSWGNNLADGLYYVAITTPQNRWMVKLLVLK